MVDYKMHSATAPKHLSKTAIQFIDNITCLYNLNRILFIKSKRLSIIFCLVGF